MLNNDSNSGRDLARLALPQREEVVDRDLEMAIVASQITRMEEMRRE